MKKLLFITTMLSLAFATPQDAPIEPFSMQKLLGKGFDVSWVEFTKNIEAYTNVQVKAMKEKGFSTARIRTKLPADSSLFVLLDKVIQDCFDEGIIPIIAYNAAEYEAAPTPANMQLDSLWWSSIANHYQNYSHRLLFDLNIEWSNVGGKDIDGVNRWYETITPAIRATNPTRIILYSPIKLSNPEYLPDMIIPESAGSYVMAEFHSYAAGPNPDSLSANGNPNPKFWTTGTEYQKSLVSDMISAGRSWQDSTGIATWLGAWMAGNKNHGNSFSPAEQAVFASYFVHVLDSLEIPWAINTLDMYYDINSNIWIDSMAPVLVALQGSSDSTPIQESQSLSKRVLHLSQSGQRLYVKTPEMGMLQIFSLNGKSVGQYETFTDGLIGESLAKGVYLLRFKGNSLLIQQKILIP